MKNTGQCSKFDQHIIDTAHEYDTKEKQWESCIYRKKIQMLNIYERFYIHKATKQDQQVNDTYMEVHNPIYVIMLTTYTT
jgi:hypothetical protein